MIMFLGYILALIVFIVFLIHTHHMKRDLRASYVILQETNGKLLAAKRERMHYKVAAELLMEEKNPRNTRIKHKSEVSRGTSADFGSSRQDVQYSRQTSDDSSILAAAVLATAGSSYDYGSSSDSSCDSSSSYSGSCDT